MHQLFGEESETRECLRHPYAGKGHECLSYVDGVSMSHLSSNLGTV